MSDTYKIMSALLQFGEEMDANKRKYATSVGEVSIAWNSLHRLFYACFAGLLNLSYDVSKALWETSGTDSGQRAMLSSIVDLVKDPMAKKELMKALADANTIGAYRNSLVHTVMDMDYDTLKLKPAEYINNDKHIKRIKLIDEKNLYEAIKQDIEDVHTHLVLGMPSIVQGKPYTLSERPPLRVYAYQTPPVVSQTHPDKGRGQ